METNILNPSLLADGILAFHLLWVLFVITMVPLVLLGGFRGWSWVRKRSLRFLHLAMIGVVVSESVVGIPCPLTVWENALRHKAGTMGYRESFLGHWLSELLYYDFPPIFFTVSYVFFGLLVVFLYWWVPPFPRKVS